MKQIKHVYSEISNLKTEEKLYGTFRRNFQDICIQLHLVVSQLHVFAPVKNYYFHQLTWSNSAMPCARWGWECKTSKKCRVEEIIYQAHIAQAEVTLKNQKFSPNFGLNTAKPKESLNFALFVLSRMQKHLYLGIIFAIWETQCVVNWKKMLPI